MPKFGRTLFRIERGRLFCAVNGGTVLYGALWLLLTKSKINFPVVPDFDISDSK